MEAIIFDHTPSTVNTGNSSIALRSAFLIADSVVAAGDIYLAIEFEHLFSNVSFPWRFRHLEEHFAKRDDMQSLNIIKELSAAYKSTGKIKSKGKADIIAMKKIEKTVNAAFEAMLAESMAQIKQSGLLQLQPLAVDGIFDYRPMGVNSPEQKSDEYFPASEILMLTEMENPAIVQIFCLQANFFSPAFFDTLTIHNTASTEALQPGVVWFEPLFTFPNLNALLSTQLAAARDSLRPHALPFTKKVDEWVQLCRNGAGANETLAFFSAHVKPASLPLSENIQSNAAIAPGYQITLPEHKFEALFGEMPVSILWEFYRFFGVTKKETLDKLEQAKSDKAFGGRWPVMILRHPLVSPKIAEEEQQEVVAVKKSISLD